MDKCITCVYWNKPKETDSTTGECHRYAPTPIGAVYQTAAAEVKLAKGASWPCTEEDDWCGEWKHNPTPSLSKEELRRLKDSMYLNR